MSTKPGVYDAHLATILGTKWAKSKNRHISAIVWANLTRWRICILTSWPIPSLKFPHSENHDGGGRHLQISKNRHIIINNNNNTRMWANAQRDGRFAEYRWRPLFIAAKFGWRPLLECRAVTRPRRETHWNLQGCLKLANRSLPLVGGSSPYCEDMWEIILPLNNFFRLSICALVAKIYAVYVRDHQTTSCGCPSGQL